MKVLSSMTDGGWLESAWPQHTPTGGTAANVDDPALAEARRALSDALRCTNLLVLCGLGTSLCVQPASPGGPKAPTMRDLWVHVQTRHDALAATAPLPTASFAQLLRMVGHPEGRQDIEALLSRCRLAESFLTGAERDEVVRFIQLAESIIIAATDFVSVDHPLPVHTEFLRRVARRSQRKSRTKVFTTNYDRCFEEAGRQGRYVVVDGFSQTLPPTFDAIHFTYETARRVAETEALDPIPNLFHLYKLHGSVDWRRQTASGEITKWTQHGQPVLIYPRNAKYELAFEQPYLEMMGAFQSALRQPDTSLLVVGFGFNDNHLAEPIMAAIRSNLSLKLVVVSPSLVPGDAGGGQGLGECVTNRHLARLHDLAVAGDARIALIHGGFEDMVPLVPDLAAETDLERHVERLRRVGAA